MKNIETGDVDLDVLFATLEAGATTTTTAKKRMQGSFPALHSVPTDTLLTAFRLNLVGAACDRELLRRGIPPSLWPWPAADWVDTKMRRVLADHRWLQKRLRRREPRNHHLGIFLRWSQGTVAKLPSQVSAPALARLFGLSKKLQGECCWLRAEPLPFGQPVLTVRR